MTWCPFSESALAAAKPIPSLDPVMKTRTILESKVYVQGRDVATMVEELQMLRNHENEEQAQLSLLEWT